ncbi:MAG: serine hydrolase domain-containing protein [Caldilineaceae bacterium]
MNKVVKMFLQAEQIDALFAAWDTPASPGCALGVVQDGELVYAQGYGMANLELGAPITTDSAFYLASVSKQFTAMTMALLAEAGRIKLTDDVRTYVPEVPDYGTPITIEQMIRHTSGLRDYLDLGFMAGKRMEDVWTEADFLAQVSRQKALNFAPGTRYLYSNTGYVLLSLIVKRVTGKSLGAFAQEQIFGPLGMMHTVFKEDHQQIIPHRVSGYAPAPNGDGFINEYHNLQVVGDGGLYSTVADLARWDANFYANRLGQGSPALIDRMYSTASLSDGAPHTYAFGLDHATYRGLPIIAHGGGLNGARTQMFRFPDQRCTIICLANLTSFDPHAMIKRVADLILVDHLGDAGDAPPADDAAPAPATIQLDATALSAYTGAYFSPELDATYRLTANAGQLSLSFRGQESIPLQSTATDQFQDEGDRKLVFDRTADDAIAGFELSNGRVWGIQFEHTNMKV